VTRTGLRRDELVTLADIGALNAFGYDRRSALWQAERAVRPTGELFDEAGGVGEAGRAEGGGQRAEGGEQRAESREQRAEGGDQRAGGAGWPGRTAQSEEEIDSACGHAWRAASHERLTTINAETAELADQSEQQLSADSANSASKEADACPLKPMTEAERIVADYAGTGLTVGRHPMALRREELATRGILRASDLRSARQGRRIRVAGMVITRQRPGTAKGFVFLTLEDETGIANIIVRPDLFARDRLTIVEEPFLIVDGVLQNQDGVTSVRAEQVFGMRGGIADSGLDFDAHDFY
jgi:error-prone DNA polymerase